MTPRRLGELLPDNCRTVLFVTQRYPFPAFSGDLQYTISLLRSVLPKLEKLLLVCTNQHLDPPLTDMLRSDHRVQLFNFPPAKLSVLRRAVSLSPNSAQIGHSTEAVNALRQAMAEFPDLAIINHIGSSWAVPHLPKNLPIFYITHNDEVLSRYSIWQQRSGFSGLPHLFDAARLLIRDFGLFTRAQKVTAISRADAQSQSRRYGRRDLEIVYPTWTSPIPKMMNFRATERNVLILGSYTWAAKRDNLLVFLDENYEGFRRLEIGIVIAGWMDESFEAELKIRYPSCKIMRNLPDERDAMALCRLVIFFGKAGGGFRLTTLNAAMHGMPIASPANLVVDLGFGKGDFLPLISGEDIPQKIGDVIDDFLFLELTAKKARLSALPFAEHYDQVVK